MKKTKNREIFRRGGFDKPLALTIFILISIGMLMVFSSSAVLSNEIYNRPFNFFINQVIGAVVGIVLMILIMTSRFPFYKNSYFIYGLLATSLLLLALCLFMPTIANTNRWIVLFGLRFQPSELAKISLILFLALYLDKKRDKINELSTLVAPVSVIILIILLIIKEPDIGTAVLILTIAGLMLFIGGVKLNYFLYLAGISLTGLALYALKFSYVIERLTSFIHPTNDPQGAFQAVQSKLAVGAGGLLGTGLGESTQKLFFLPCAHTDYIYAIVGEEFGLLGSLGVLALFGIFFWRGLVIARNASDLFSRLLAVGITTAISLQALLNISIALGLAPTTGLPLPLFSFGRSSLVVTLFSMGILLHISQRKAGQRKR